MIKKLMILIVFGVVSLWAEEAVTVQVISAVYEKSITAEFDAKLKKLHEPVHKKVENGRYVVTVGHFTPEKSALTSLKNARKLISPDAFIRTVDRNGSIAVSAKAKTGTPLVATEHKKASISATAVGTSPVISSPAVATTVSVATSPAVSVSAVTQAPAGKPSVPVIMLECDKKEMRKDEIAEAIAYYKNSPYHRFQPVGLHR